MNRRLHPIWEIHGEGSLPIVAAAIHNGHEVRPDVADLLQVNEAVRLREEDPRTGDWTHVSDNRIVLHRSRFEMDLNRPRDGAVYLKPEDAWGIKVWKSPPPPDLIARSFAQYDAFYRELGTILEKMSARFGCFVVLDIHSYNHRREGAASEPADFLSNPEVNVGTGTLDRRRWGSLVERFLGDFRAYRFFGRSLDVRENVKFRGAQFAKWIHETFPVAACVLAVEFKKIFMDEWTGAFDEKQFQALGQALRSTVPGVLKELARAARLKNR